MEFASDSPGPTGSGSTPKSPWPVFLQRFKPQPLHKRPVQKTSAESPAESSEEDSFQTKQRKSKPPEKMSRAQGRYSVYNLQFKLQAIRDVQASDTATVAKKLNLPRSTLETWLKKYNLQELERQRKGYKEKRCPLAVWIWKTS